MMQQKNDVDVRMPDGKQLCVEVLLSTWNGSPYIEEQLASLYAQHGAFALHVRIRDDGSSDDTVRRIRHFAMEHAERQVLSQENTPVQKESGLSHQARELSIQAGENLGFIRSFFTLLSQVTDDVDYIAFCDQDDVWQPDKLACAIQWLQAEEVKECGHPLLYTSRLRLVDKELQPIGFSRTASRSPAIANALVENIVTGATLVMNRAACALVLRGLWRIEPAASSWMERMQSAVWKDMLLHDWWCYLVVSAFGKVLYDPEPGILYRQHGGNQVGQNAGFVARQIKRLKRFRKNGDMRGITQQAALFRTLYLEELSLLGNAERQCLEGFLSRDERVLKRLRYALHPGVWRQAWYDNLLLRLLILFNRI